MKKIILIHVLLFAFCTVLFAQKHNNKQRREEINSKKIAYLTDKMQLSTEEAKAFWPVYNELFDKLHEVHMKERKLHKKLRNSDNLSKKMLEEIHDDLIEMTLLKAELKKEYHAKYKELISIEKIMALYKGERDFRRFLMQRIGRKGFKGDSPGEPPHIDFFE